MKGQMQMRGWKPLAAVLLLAVQATYAQSEPAPAPVATVQGAPTEIAVPLRGQYVLTPAGSPARIAVGDPQVADVKVLPPAAGRPGQVLVLGKKAGNTEVQIWTAGARAPQRWNVRVTGDVQGVLAERGLNGGTSMDVAGAATVLSGQAASLLDHRGAVEAGKNASGPNGVADLSTVATGSVVQVEVKVVELSRTAMKEAGISSNFSQGPWSVGSSFAPTDLVPPSNGFSLLYDTAHFSATLRLLETVGMARVLAEPTLLAQSGQSASFLAGGEIPVPESGGLGTQNVVYKPFGIGLTVTPTVLARDRIGLKVAPEASELDPTNGIPVVNGNNVTVIPALQTRKADTTVELGDGETFIIGGLVSRQTKAQVSKVPFLGDLPIIGAFFRGIQYSQNDTELVFVVTPRLVRPIARGVSLPLPGGSEEVSNRPTTAWGYYLMGPSSGQQMPGFSR
jgi:pilus assembly protein CpaC